MDVVTSSSDEEYDPRAGLVSDTQPPQLPPYGLLQPSSHPMFDDPVSKFLQPISGVHFSNQLTPDPSYDMDAMMNSSCPRPVGFIDPSLLIRSVGNFQNTAPLATENATRDPGDPVLTAQQSIRVNKAAGRNRKKRARASRRAPTTIMTTDTANFRSMVQEFTGIPATSFVPSHLHRAGIGLLGPNKLGFGSKLLEPQLTTYSNLLGPFAPKTKSATTFSDGYSFNPQLALSSDLGLLSYQPFVQLQAQTEPIGSRPQPGHDKYSILASTGGECTNEPGNHSNPMADFHVDQAVQNDLNPTT